MFPRRKRGGRKKPKFKWKKQTLPEERAELLQKAMLARMRRRRHYSEQAARLEATLKRVRYRPPVAAQLVKGEVAKPEDGEVAQVGEEEEARRKGEKMSHAAAVAAAAVREVLAEAQREKAAQLKRKAPALGELEDEGRVKRQKTAEEQEQLKQRNVELTGMLMALEKKLTSFAKKKHGLLQQLKRIAQSEQKKERVEETPKHVHMAPQQQQRRQHMVPQQHHQQQRPQLQQQQQQQHYHPGSHFPRQQQQQHPRYNKPRTPTTNLPSPPTIYGHIGMPLASPPGSTPTYGHMIMASPPSLASSPTAQSPQVYTIPSNQAYMLPPNAVRVSLHHASGKPVSPQRRRMFKPQQRSSPPVRPSNASLEPGELVSSYNSRQGPPTHPGPAQHSRYQGSSSSSGYRRQHMLGRGRHSRSGDRRKRG